ncbi:DUF4239 domain-containing protein [Amycolatopsis regifaucium]|uniref:DUF4239 domain-containing protein n=1 Tax=Amycolatopsis regifaucium TaxID=546365 RepID=A0A154M6U7_9PSEU|nr:DUF4239 domain-containing protein [Amycolatopsis regifaucium]KZB80140.1 hypothetical protein AVL48_14040 [Amycolatopsis regifaucium]OKA09490.1 hypothetical protein ATP06_0208510 [Amycolatopsis regifaucium]SFH63111.1 Protein of unknown function [Amycolatopsis regifaucium]
MGIYLTGIAWVVGAAIFAGFVGYLVRKFGWEEGRRDNNDAAGQVFTIVGGLHAVLVAFILISLFDSASAARDGSYHEADSLVAAVWAADSLGAEAKDEVRKLSAEYITTVEQREWPLMAEGDETVPDTGWAQLDQLRKAVEKAPSDDDWVRERKAEATAQLWQVYEARQSRLNAVEGSRVGGVVWFALILGSLISVLLPNLFGGTRLAAHLVIVSTLAGTITLLLFAIYQLQNPFGGGIRIPPDAFTAARARLA